MGWGGWGGGAGMQRKRGGGRKGKVVVKLSGFRTQLSVKDPIAVTASAHRCQHQNPETQAQSSRARRRWRANIYVREQRSFVCVGFSFQMKEVFSGSLFLLSLSESIRAAFMQRQGRDETHDGCSDGDLPFNTAHEPTQDLDP